MGKKWNTSEILNRILVFPIKVKIIKAKAIVQPKKTTIAFLKPNSLNLITTSALMKRGLNQDEAQMIIDQCKQAKKQYDYINENHCILVAVGIAWAESSGCRNDGSNNCWGLYKGKYYPTKTIAFKRWLQSYVKYWYKAKNAYFFYGTYGKLGPSRYCGSETSSNSNVGCPNGNRRMQQVIDSFKNIID